MVARLKGKTFPLRFDVLKKIGTRSLVVGNNWIQDNSITLQSDGTKLRVFVGKNGTKNYTGDFQSPRAVMKLNGAKKEGVVDTGATESHIGKRLLSPALKAQVTPTKQKVKLFDGTKVKMVGRLRVQANFEEKKVHQCIFVV